MVDEVRQDFHGLLGEGFGQGPVEGAGHVALVLHHQVAHQLSVLWAVGDEGVHLRADQAGAKVAAEEDASPPTAVHLLHAHRVTADAGEDQVQHVTYVCFVCFPDYEVVHGSYGQK